MTNGPFSARHRLYPEHLCRIKRILERVGLWVIGGAAIYGAARIRPRSDVAAFHHVRRRLPGASVRPEASGGSCHPDRLVFESERRGACREHLRKHCS
jgi:hypothetical protein